MVEAFASRGLDMPKVCLTTYSLNLRALMVATGPFITALPAFTVRLDANRLPLKALPVDLPVRSWPVAIVTLKNRTLSPVAELFIDHVRDFTSALVAQGQSETRSA
jgi:DNA-binding transcriptional LysR family regulator